MYIDATPISNHIYVSERDSSGKRSVISYLPPYVFYYDDPNGQYTSISGDKLKRFRSNKKYEWESALNKKESQGHLIFEKDVPETYRLLEEKYTSDGLPDLHIGIIDIEVDKDAGRDHASIDDPYAPITAITLLDKHEKQFYTLVVPPPGMTVVEARDLLDQKSVQQVDGSVIPNDGRESDEFGTLSESSGYFVCANEEELLLLFLELIDDIDVLTGWNSTWYDLPYIIHRIRITLGKEKIPTIAIEKGDKDRPCKPSEASTPHLLRLCLFPKLPKLRMADHYGNMEKTYQIFGRTHLDYQELYQKFGFVELHSYALEFVLREEVKQSKVAYDGSLDQLYRKSFRRFVAYNRQDVAGLSALDDKKKLIHLANMMAHMAGVTMDKVLGSVVIIEQAILKRLHRKGLICFNKQQHTSDLPVPGGFVVTPDAGIYELLCSYDFNSLYPTTIRMLNISPEAIIGQFDIRRTITKWKEYMAKYGEASLAWAQFTGVLEYHDIVDGTDELLTMNIEGDDTMTETRPAHEWKEALRKNNWSISAYGTVFKLNEPGIVAQCMEEWYSERQEFQKKKKDYHELLEKATDPVQKAELKIQEDYYDMLQTAKKLFLNSTYGAYLNQYFRFYDPRLGASVTLSGRVMTKHMVKKGCELITGNYDFDSNAKVYGDTDSAYFKLDWLFKETNINPTDELLIKAAEELGARINKSLPDFLDSAFFIGQKRGLILEAKLDTIGRRGLFKDGKKRYAIHLIYKEGYRVDKMKIMGMETRRSDTPKYIQEFLEHILTMVVKDNKTYIEVRQYVDDFRYNIFRKMDPWLVGSPSRVRNLTVNAAKINEYASSQREGYVGGKKPTTSFAVMAANNTNRLIVENHETRWPHIHDGDKVSVLYLRDNPYEVKTIAFPVGERYVPDWFRALPVDLERMENKLIDMKLYNVLGVVLGWDFTSTQEHLC